MTTAVAPYRFESSSGLVAQVNANGSLRRMDHRDIILNLFPGNEIEGGPANIYLRRHDTAIESIPLLGPRSPAAIRVDDHGVTVQGKWRQLRFQARLVLAASAPVWIWNVLLENRGAEAVAIDLIYAQDLGLAHYAAVRMNEYYVSQYIDYTPLTHPRCGSVLAVRQNLSMGGHNPWAMIGSTRNAVSFATDALELHGLSTRAGEVAAGLRAPSLPGRRRQHEHSMAVIQDAQTHLASGSSVRCGFFGWYEENHPAASSPADLGFADRALALPEIAATPTTSDTVGPVPVSPTLFTTAPFLESRALTEAEVDEFFGKSRRNIERDDGGRLLSFFTEAGRHVVLKAKELEVLRPHGHLIRSGNRLVPDEASMTSTTWFTGVFHSLVTQGHVNINRMLSTTRSYLGLFRSGGQRAFVEHEGTYHLLDLPSAYEISPNGCRWIYKHDAGVIEVRSWAPIDRHELILSIEVLNGPECRFLISHHIAINGDDGAEAIPVRLTRENDSVAVHPVADSDVGRRFPAGFFRMTAAAGTTFERVGGDELLFLDAGSRRQPFVTLMTATSRSAQLRITGHLVAAADPPERAERESQLADADRFWSDFLGPLTLHAAGASDAARSIEQLGEIVPWLAHNAMVHYLAPRGLEQYSGGGWGTRDVCQGPVELLLALGKWEPLRDLLLRIFKVQNPGGDWPQWFMFFERERNIRPAESHGDIIFWPLLALAEYLIASEDASILDEAVVFFHADGDDRAEAATVWGHVERALEVIRERVFPDTSLAVYGHGDWNDSLQPVDPALGARLCSAWTVTLHYQMIVALADALSRIDRADQSKRFRSEAKRIADDFRRRLIVDGTIVGYAHFRVEGGIEYLLHPSDQVTGIRFSLLPMIHAIINGLLTPEQARTHVSHIEEHLLGLDGARLFDRPFDYRGGPQRYFQRAESSTFFGREVGIMYMHAHLRYAEAMARHGDADALFLALRQANPCGLRALVPQTRPRQANCYYSSSDACFPDRYEALSAYANVKAGEVDFEGGWRIYSSGAGILLRLVRERFLGIRLRKTMLVIDPVIPTALDGLRVDTEIAGRPVTISYRAAAAGCGPTRITLNGDELPFEREDNPYRPGGAEVSMSELKARLNDAGNTLEIQLH